MRQMERGNITNKKKRGREEFLGEDQDVFVDHMEDKTIDTMTTNFNTSKKLLQYPCDHIFGCLESVDGNCSKSYKICNNHHEEEEIGVFDFPWLTGGGEGVIFKGDHHHHEHLCLQEMGMGIEMDHQEQEGDPFALYSSIVPAADTTPGTTSSASPALHHDLITSSAHKIHPTILEDDGNVRLSCSSQVDNADDINSSTDQYAIWSSVLDQPLDINLNI
ncbi:hypothetical protein ACH5RR_017393 [Cinchona calisaya]|uniref:Uncharacterized protein n=1 Tax=Cinchona calisaya TaxID=153742 RepID=A0ABD2ZJE2_9GENT